jgi:hypothetical protein
MWVFLLFVWYIVHVANDVYIGGMIQQHEQYEYNIRRIRMTNYSYEGYMDAIELYRNYKQQLIRLEINLFMIRRVKRICGKYYYHMTDIPFTIDFQCELLRKK